MTFALAFVECGVGLAGRRRRASRASASVGGSYDQQGFGSDAGNVAKLHESPSGHRVLAPLHSTNANGPATETDTKDHDAD